MLTGSVVNHTLVIDASSFIVKLAVVSYILRFDSERIRLLFSWQSAGYEQESTQRHSFCKFAESAISRNPADERVRLMQPAD